MNNDKIITKNNDLDSGGFYQSLFTTFAAVFVAELGDKTQLATLLLSAESGRPIVVFFAASLALIATSLIGVIIGQLLSNIISPYLFQRVAAIVMIIISLIIFLNLLNSNNILNLIIP